MVGKYVRCTITPTDGTTQGQPYVAVFPTKIRTAANAGWQETVIDYVTFDSDVVAAKFGKGGAAPADMTLTWDENKKAMKMTGWTLAEDGTFNLSGKYSWNYRNLPVHHETELFITFDHYITAGTVSSNMQSGMEGLRNTTPNELHEPIRAGFYDYGKPETSVKQFKSSRNWIEQANSSCIATALRTPGSILTESMLQDEIITTFWYHSHNEQTITNVDAIYIDNFKVVEKTIPYTVTVKENGQTVKTETVGTGKFYVFEPVLAAGKKLATVTVNGEAAQIKDGRVQVDRIYQDTEINYTVADLAIDHLSLEENPVYYKGTDRAEAPLILTAYDAAGNKYNVTGLEGVVYESSDPSVFSVNGNKVKSNGKVGFANITATYKGQTTGISMMRTAGVETPVTETTIDKNFKADPAVKTGRDGGQAYFADGFKAYDTSLTGASWKVGGMVARVQTGRGNWIPKKLYTVTGWFYDDGDKNSTPGANPSIYTNFAKEADKAYGGVSVDLSEFMSYGEFEWNFTETLGGFQVGGTLKASGDTYVWGTTDLQINRTVGWHQVVYTLHQDPTAVQGWSTSCYLDGQLVSKSPVRISGVGDSDMELRHTAPVQNSTQVYYYDDFTVIGGILPEYAGVKYTIGANGAVKVGTTAKETGKWDYVNVGDNLTLTLVPDAGYKAVVTVDGVDAPVSASNEVTVENIQQDTQVAVTFEELPVTPSISGNDADYIVTEDNYYKGNQPAYVAYYKMVVPADATLGEYGMYFNEKNGADENKVRLVALGKNEMNMFGIRVFGDAVKADKEYTFKGFAVIDGEEYSD
ncbi:MAG: hypothetical protein E7399_03395 [Ruminococcaceae bacterium]|nr:hypothetical protein [Oscillospiraceae bacterium]